MTPSEYVKAALRTEQNNDPESIQRLKDRMVSKRGDRLIHAALGITTETGELVDVVKRFIRYGKDVDRNHVAEEVGDVLWYLAIVVDELGFTFEEAMEKNVAKLSARYPNLFTEESALNRDLDKERAILGVEA